MSEERVKITIDGRELEAPKGATVIQVADEAGIYIPRFCYHRRLKIAANCRMCLVDVEGAPKPVASCAHPVADGMVVHTRSQRALDAQRATMEFLLINHPLDCPICDQGGECELQDLALGYGRGISRFTERKRVVADKDLGPLVLPEMTRCIHCTRCIRVLEEVGGRQEMGATGRGEHTRIGTYIAGAIDSELSGNIIDVCPVGALNSAPFNMRARGWELLSHKTVGAHDCVGSNLYGHTLRGRFLRVVPRENEEVNDCWISDRDRFSYTGLESSDRLLRPMVRKDGRLVEVEWPEAVPVAAQYLREAGPQFGAIVSPNATLEEMYLTQKLVRALGSRDVDSRLRQSDFRDDEGDPRFPALGDSMDGLKHADAVFLVGSRINKEAPIIAYRLRQAAAAGGAIMMLNPRRFDVVVPLVVDRVAHPDSLVGELAGVAHALAEETGRKTPAFLDGFPRVPGEQTREIARKLAAAGRPRLLLGHLALQHPAFADLRRVAVLVAELADGTLGYVTEGANQCGAYLAGAVPHRGPGGVPLQPGRNVREMFEEPLGTYLLLGAEPELDCWNGAQARNALGQAKVVALSSFLSPALREYADCVLPLAAFGETPGAFVNAAGTRQTFDAVSVPPGDTRPGWKILRALGGELAAEHGFAFASFGEVRSEVWDALGDATFSIELPAYAGTWEPAPGTRKPPSLRAVTEVGIYATDPLVRRAKPLQQTPDARDSARIWLHPEDAAAMRLSPDELVEARSESVAMQAELGTDPGVVRGTVWLPAGFGLGLWESVSLEAVAQAAEA